MASTSQASRADNGDVNFTHSLTQTSHRPSLQHSYHAGPHNYGSALTVNCNFNYSERYTDTDGTIVPHR